MTPVSSDTVAELPRGLARMRRVLGRLGYVELYVAEAMFIFVVPLTIAQVFLRYGFDINMVWAQEISQLAFLVAFFLVFPSTAVRLTERCWL